MKDVERENVAIDRFRALRENRDMARRSRHRVVALVGEQSSVFDLAVAAEVFGRDPHVGVPWYRFTVATEHPGLVQFELGLNLTVDHGLSAFRAADTIIVVGLSPASPDVVRALRAAHRRGVRIVSLCVGAFVLAAAGLLDGRRATSHWHVTGKLRSIYPDIDVVTDVLYVDEGDVLTSAGVAAAIDLAVHLVRLDHGAEVANEIARNMVVAPHRHGGQAQFVKAPAATVAAGRQSRRHTRLGYRPPRRPHVAQNRVTLSLQPSRRGNQGSRNTPDHVEHCNRWPVTTTTRPVHA